MSTVNKRHNTGHAQCRRCGHDLETRNLSKTKHAYVYCTNGRCKHAKKPHPTSWRLNVGPVTA